MAELRSDNKRLAKNTILLYTRTFFVMAITLFTSRIILNALGVEDYGINNIVGGFVGFFSIISGTLIATTQRYLNFELGKSVDSNPRKVFGASMAIHIVLVIILFIIFETVGLWFLNVKLNIPTDRFYAANWVYQFSILAFLLNILSTPYLALIIAHEKMSAFAYISLLDVSMKLCVAYLVSTTTYDRLIIYSFFILIIAVIDQSVYWLYSKRHFPESTLSIVKDKGIYKEMFGFAGMNSIGAFATILANQGLDIVLNLFFGVTINAARGISNQILHAVTKFVNDFMTALNPQITKEYASGNREYSKVLCLRGSKFSFFLMMFFAIPLFFRMPYILDLWLVNYPEYAIVFTRCALLLSFITLLSNALITEILATGNLTKTTFWIGGVRLLSLPLAYIVFKLGYSPTYGYYTLMIIEIISLFVRLKILESITAMFFIRDFIKQVFVPVLVVFFIIIPINWIISSMISQTILGFIVYCTVSVLLSIISILYIGLSSTERTAIINMVNSKIFHRR